VNSAKFVECISVQLVRCEYTLTGNGVDHVDKVALREAQMDDCSSYAVLVCSEPFKHNNLNNNLSSPVG